MKKLFCLSILAAFVACGCSDSAETDTQTVSSTKSPMINGKLDDSEAHRAVVAFRNRGEAESTFCTGTLVAPNYVITAAHCFGEHADQYTITRDDNAPDCEFEAMAELEGFRYGWANAVVSFGNTDGETSQTQYAIEDITIPNDYGSYVSSTCDSHGNSVQENMIINDIAIVKLQENVPESVAKPIPILPPWLGKSDELYPGNISTEFVGFGFNEKGEIGYKLTFTRPIGGICKVHDDGNGEFVGEICHYNESFTINACHPSKDYCDYYGTVHETYNSVAYYPGTMFYRQDDGGPCQGDSGGPAFVKIGGKEYLAGITSYGDSACAGYGVSTDVQSFFEPLGLGDIKEIKNQYVEVCGNGIDDDGNGLVDGDDVECSKCEATFTFYNEYTNTAENNFDVYLVGSFNTKEDGEWIVDDDNYKMTSDGKGTHTITIKYPKNASFEYKYHVNGWMNSETGQDDGWFSDAESNGNAVADFSICGKRYGVGSKEAYCGDGIFQEENDEMCDNNDFPEIMNTCSKVDPSFVSGQLKCTSKCMIDSSGCHTAEDNGGIGNVNSDKTRTSLPSDPNAKNGKITLDSLLTAPTPTGLPKPSTTDNTGTPDKPDTPDKTDTPNDDHHDDDGCSAMPLNSSHSIPGALAILFGLGTLIGLRRRKEN